MTKYPNIELLKEYIYKQAPLQKKKLEPFFASKDDDFLIDFESFLNEYSSYLKKNEMSIEYAIDSYLMLVNDMLKAQIKFMRSGKYPTENVKDAIDNVYNDKVKMLSYMLGLGLSQYLWSTHYTIYNFFKEELEKNKNQINNYIEIGPGHGLFLKSAIDILNVDSNIIAIDISKTSLDISKSIITYFYPQKDVNYIHKDMLELDLDSQCDFVLMGEVIEHVEEPAILLKKVKKLLKKDGVALLSTCVNCPAIDHIYHFHKVDEIRKMFNDCGLKIVKEVVLPVEDLTMEEIIDKKITINYAAVVKKADND